MSVFNCVNFPGPIIEHVIPGFCDNQANATSTGSRFSSLAIFFNLNFKLDKNQISFFLLKN